ncbi:aldo/keto reductase [Microbacterium sp. No. 7]|uniref:aldo/keto reductase n=1 Tax=Microbacterium sp. No. 7 TaxID=1714373 RepID=UPI0006D29CAB|nr:aldo/keto reductase [Microbacterium sp. No. 7]ALJ19144.1 aldo/keto reductase [Microbacterium sp. No. 7]
MTSTTPTLTTIELGDGLRVPIQGFGAMSLTDVYGPVSDDDALATLTHAVDAGVTFIDTANIYGEGRSERIISRLLRTRRDEVQLATKVGIAPRGTVGRRAPRGDRAHIREQIDLSLGRLGTDAVDLYYLHRVDPQVPIEDSVGALAELVAEGKVRHIGLSEATGDELRRASSVHRIAAVQSEWSIVSRDVEAHVVPAARELGIVFVPYSPLSRQWLTGVFDESVLTDADTRRSFPRFAPDVLAANAPLLDEVRQVATEAGLSPAQLSLAWLYAKGRELDLPVVPIPGTRFADRVDENLAAVDAVLGADHVARLDILAARVTGHRSFDPAWVSAGRE